MTKEEKLEAIDAISVMLNFETELHRLTQELLPEHTYYNYGSVQDVICKMFTGQVYEERYDQFCSPASASSGKIVSWVKSGDKKDPLSIKYGLWGYTGDMLIDVIGWKKPASYKYEALTAIFKYEKELIDERKKSNNRNRRRSVSSRRTKRTNKLSATV